MNVIATPLGAGGRTAMKEINVIGTMQLLAACQKAPSVRKLVVKSTTAVYGSSPRDPALFTEDMEPRALPRSGYAKDPSRSRATSAGSAAVAPTSTSRCCASPTSSARSSTRPLTRLLRRCPSCPTVLGFDPRIQFCHEDDALGGLLRRALVRAPRAPTTSRVTAY